MIFNLNSTFIFILEQTISTLKQLYHLISLSSPTKASNLEKYLFSNAKAGNGLSFEDVNSYIFPIS